MATSKIIEANAFNIPNTQKIITNYKEFVGERSTDTINEATNFTGDHELSTQGEFTIAKQQGPSQNDYTA